MDKLNLKFFILLPFYTYHQISGLAIKLNNSIYPKHRIIINVIIYI